ncbi:hypothetical protein F2Q68_00017371 [Brassica cretica]|uniref:Uncharacterized protein n=1 Tax=Brassica cretica TaxID=69181 RepID=A0A8S9HIK2_BRACR|nr:hypothetical protein F2Q68_00017371 [Brassica cretica]
MNGNGRCKFKARSRCAVAATIGKDVEKIEEEKEKESYARNCVRMVRLNPLIP